MASALNVQRLWTSADGTLCLMVERDEVVRQDRLYARASAQMLAETWRSTFGSAGAQPYA